MNNPDVIKSTEDVAGCSLQQAGSASPVPTPDKHPQSDYDDEWSGEEDDCCHYCGGDGCVMGDELDDPLWYDADKVYRCPCCNGSGAGKDCTFW